jgi:hypothetical protein
MKKRNTLRNKMNPVIRKWTLLLYLSFYTVGCQAPRKWLYGCCDGVITEQERKLVERLKSSIDQHGCVARIDSYAALAFLKEHGSVEVRRRIVQFIVYNADLRGGERWGELCMLLPKNIHEQRTLFDPNTLKQLVGSGQLSLSRARNAVALGLIRPNPFP